jgi:hypothetical protein
MPWPRAGGSGGESCEHRGANRRHRPLPDRVSHSPVLVYAVVDDPNSVSCASLAPVVALAERCGLNDLVAGKLTLPVLGG